MRLVIAEKPDVARKLGVVLGATKKGEGCLEGRDVVVTWAIGHLVEIAEPEMMDPSWGGAWSMSQLPMVPAQWQYAVKPKVRAQFAVVKRLMKAASEVVCATDAGREGELIFRLIYELAGCRAPVKRLWISTQTEEAILRGFAELKPSQRFDGLAAAAKARARADWVVGLNLTRAYTVHNGSLCTIGRVQTPTLAMIVERQEAIDAFVPTPYFEVRAVLEPGFVARYVEGGQSRLASRERADQVAREIAAEASGRATSVETKDVSTSAPHLFDLTSLQQEANKRWGHTAAETLALAQELYEAKLLSYPRTESRHLSHDLVPTLPGILDALSGRFGEAVTAAKAGMSRRPLGKAYVDDAKLTDHHALIPTNVPSPESLRQEAAHIYDLVCRRFMAIFLDPLVRAETVALFAIGAHTFRASGSIVKEAGWTLVSSPAATKKSDSEDEEEETQGLPALVVGSICAKRSECVAASETSPPRQYTDGTLVEAMKHAGAALDDADLAAYMSHAGLGTTPTRGEIIERLIRSGYLERQRKALVPTAKGRALIAQVHPDVKSPALTAQWEQRLKSIENGGDSVEAFERDIAAHVRAVIEHVGGTAAIAAPALAAGGTKRTRGRGRRGRARGGANAASPPARSSEGPATVTELGRCPLCGVGAVRVSAKAYGCSRWREGCGFTIWRDIAHKTITAEIAQELLACGRTKKLAGFKGKNGSFSAALQLNGEKKVVLDFA